MVSAAKAEAGGGRDRERLRGGEAGRSSRSRPASGAASGAFASSSLCFVYDPRSRFLVSPRNPPHPRALALGTRDLSSFLFPCL